ncbi:MAG: hypothetical protein V4549_07360 [Bacteroidota bacterium]
MPDELTIEQKIAADMSASYAEHIGANVPPVVPPVEPPVPPVEPPVEPPPVVPPVVPPVEPPVPPVEPPVEKTFEDYLAERSGGKYKKWEDVEVELTPKEIFANEKIKHLNDLAEKGVDVTSREFLELQSLDFDKMDKVEDILFEKWKRGEEGKGLSERTIRYEINKKYNVNEWTNKEAADLTEDDIANREKMFRDSNESKSWLTNYKNERVLEKTIDPSEVEAMAETQRRELQNWDTFVDSNLVSKITKLSTPISYKDETDKVVESVLDFPVSAKSLQEVGEMMKQLPRNSNAFFDQFNKKDGSRDHEAFAIMMLKAKSFDEARALSYSAGAEQRALVIEKTSKNTNFKPAEVTPQGKVFTTVAEAQADAIRNMKVL